MKKIFLRILSILFLAMLLLNPKISIEGARAGLTFWFQTMIPTLLPFIIGSNLIIMLDATKYLTAIVNKLFGKLLKISENGCYVVLIGLLCGYPMGAKTSADMVENYKIEKKEGQYLLSFCNHASPMFLIGFVFTLIQEGHKLLFLISYYLPVLPIILMAQFYYKVQKPAAECSSFNTVLHAAEKLPKIDVLDQAMMNGFEVILKVGGHILLFSILETYFSRLPISNLVIKSLILGVTEITTGLAAIGDLFGKSSTAALIAVTVTAFGGLSGLSQTKSVIKPAGLSVTDYFMWKALHGLLSASSFLLLLNFFG